MWSTLLLVSAIPGERLSPRVRGLASESRANVGPGVLISLPPSGGRDPLLRVWVSEPFYVYLEYSGEGLGLKSGPAARGNIWNPSILVYLYCIILLTCFRSSSSEVTRGACAFRLSYSYRDLPGPGVLRSEKKKETRG